MRDSIRIRTDDEQTAVALAYYYLARFYPDLVRERDGFEVRIESESEDDLPHIFAILDGGLDGASAALSVLFNGEPRPGPLAAPAAPDEARGALRLTH